MPQTSLEVVEDHEKDLNQMHNPYINTSIHKGAITGFSGCQPIDAIGQAEERQVNSCLVRPQKTLHINLTWPELILHHFYILVAIWDMIISYEGRFTFLFYYIHSYPVQVFQFLL